MLQGSNGEELKEYGATTNGTHSTCYVLTSTKDIITLHQKLSPGVAEFVDLQVDGILRESTSTERPDKEFKWNLKKVFLQERLTGERGLAASVKYCRMEVHPRNAKHGMCLIF